MGYVDNTNGEPNVGPYSLAPQMSNHWWYEQNVVQIDSLTVERDGANFTIIWSES